MTYFFLFFKRNDILVDVIIFAKDKVENQKKFCKRKMEENMEKNKIKKIALIFNILQVIALAVFEVVLFRLVSYKNKLILDYVPAKYFIILEVVLVAITIIPFLIRKGKKTSIISMIISILMAIVLFATSILGVVYDKDIKNVLNKADQTIDDVVENSKLSTEEYGVYILKSDKAEELKDIENYNLGYNLSYAKDETDSVLKDVLAKANNKLIANEYDDLLKMADELLNTEKTAFIFNQAMLDLIENAGDDTNDGKNNGIYKDFTNKIKCIYVVNVKTAVKEYGGDKNVTKECFNVYISGIDTEGDVTVKSRSDVNIIMSINPVTHQVLLLSTPRDYYVPLSISNGVKDKLTHAGNYGINVSMDTLEMLYDIKLDYFIRLNFTGFVDIIDALGGIDVVSDYSFSTHGYSYSEGLNSNLSGIQALWFARERHAFAEGDKQRGRDQMKVIEAVIKKAQSSALLNNYDEIFANISKSFQTNMPKKDIKALVKYQLNETPNWKVVSTSVTGTGRSDVTYSVPNSRAYVMDPDENSVNEAKKLLQKIQNNKKIKVKTTTE